MVRFSRLSTLDVFLSCFLIRETKPRSEDVYLWGPVVHRFTARESLHDHYWRRRRRLCRRRCRRCRCRRRRRRCCCHHYHHLAVSFVMIYDTSGILQSRIQRKEVEMQTRYCGVGGGYEGASSGAWGLYKRGSGIVTKGWYKKRLMSCWRPTVERGDDWGVGDEEIGGWGRGNLLEKVPEKGDAWEARKELLLSCLRWKNRR